MEHIISSGVFSIMISDHLPIFLIKKKQKHKATSDNIKCRSYANYEKQKYQEEIKTHPNWTNFWQVNKEDPEKMWEVMEKIILVRVNGHCPYKNVRIKEDTPPWISREILSEIRHKDYLYNKAKKSKLKEYLEIFKRNKNEVNKLLVTAKENFVKEKLDEHEGNPRKFWRTINNISALGKMKMVENAQK